jgi:hypothetical protein
MIGEMTQRIAGWAVEAGMRAAELPSPRDREAFLVNIHREVMTGAGDQGLEEHDARLLADAFVEGARRIMGELLARGMSSPQGRA